MPFSLIQCCLGQNLVETSYSCFLERYRCASENLIPVVVTVVGRRVDVEKAINFYKCNEENERCSHADMMFFSNHVTLRSVLALFTEEWNVKNRF